MATVTIRVDPTTHRLLLDASKRAGKPVGAIVAQLVQRQLGPEFWRDVDAAFGRLRRDRKAWDRYQAEAERFEAAGRRDRKQP